MAIDSNDFHFEQYKMLRTEILALVEETRKLEIQVLSGLAILYVWLSNQPSLPCSLWYLGVPLVFTAGVRSLMLFRRLSFQAKYLRDLEEVWLGADARVRLPGWERYFKREDQVRLSFVATVVWIVLLIGSLMAPHFLHVPHPSKDPTEVRLVK